MQYCMCMLTHRLQLLLDDERHRRLTEEAERRHTSVAAVIRDAIDKALPDARAARRRAAIDAILASEPVPVPDDPADLEREIEETLYDAGWGEE
jgi:hypothetical protein